MATHVFLILHVWLEHCYVMVIYLYHTLFCQYRCISRPESSACPAKDGLCEPSLHLPTVPHTQYTTAMLNWGHSLHCLLTESVSRAIAAASSIASNEYKMRSDHISPSQSPFRGSDSQEGPITTALWADNRVSPPAPAVRLRTLLASVMICVRHLHLTICGTAAPSLYILTQIQSSSAVHWPRGASILSRI